MNEKNSSKLTVAPTFRYSLNKLLYTRRMQKFLISRVKSRARPCLFARTELFPPRQICRFIFPVATLIQNEYPCYTSKTSIGEPSSYSPASFRLFFVENSSAVRFSNSEWNAWREVTSLPLFPFPETRSPFPVRLCAAYQPPRLVESTPPLSLSVRVLSRRVSPHLFSPFAATGGASGAPPPFNSAAESRIVRYRNARAYTRCVRRLIIPVNEGFAVRRRPADR